METRQPVIIVGAGPVGLALSLVLARYEVTTLVLEAREAPTPEDESRAIVWMPKGLEFLDWLGLTETFEQASHGIHRTAHEFWSSNRRLARLNFADVPSPHRYSLNLPQHYTEALLEQAAQRTGFVEVRRQHRVVKAANQDGKATVTVQTPQGEYNLEAPWAVGCDGAKSQVKLSLGIGNRWRDYGTEAAVADFVMNCDLPQDTSRIVLDPARPYGFFYFAPNRWRLIYRINKGEDHQILTSEETLTNLLRNWLPSAKVERLLWASVFRLGQGQSETYRQGRWLLAGDAAHAMGPSLGAGMMVGMLGAWRLGWRLALAAQNHPKGDALLHDYEQEQQKGSEKVQKANALVFRNIALRDPILAFVRSTILQTVFNIPIVARRNIITDTLLDQPIHVPESLANA